MAVKWDDARRGLPVTFIYSEARLGGLSDRQLYQLRDDDVIEVIDRGLFAVPMWMLLPMSIV
ncbi:hypothetical protein QLQ12_04370 [Actinoplanes sp. NEAU-A12]|uniref:Uncharacterized protein n=1 Tax=Actinoplanes sandaracinus TaxID=3045177 RepID=A0ABT6WDQ9_9ACTN|nr:hypothetical protein [Actinoplanes sandaracinus]MDI6097833.1 hypothetical protein [Actinoplanes sandaracinus]